MATPYPGTDFDTNQQRSARQVWMVQRYMSDLQLSTEFRTYESKIGSVRTLSRDQVWELRSSQDEYLLSGPTVTVYFGEIQVRRFVPIRPWMTNSEKAFEFFTANPSAENVQISGYSSNHDYMMIILKSLDRTLSQFRLELLASFYDCVGTYVAANALGIPQQYTGTLCQHICSIVDKCRLSADKKNVRAIVG